MKTFDCKTSGFSLVEMAIVLVIIGLLLGGMLMPLSAQMDQRRISETQKALDEINQALIGYAIVNRRFPRPATSSTNGAENPAACATQAACSGFIPWATLGVTKLDSWGKIFRYSVTPNFAGGAAGTAAFTLDATVATKTVQTRDSAGALVYQVGQAVCSLTNQCVPVVVFSQGKNNWGTGDTGNAFADNSSTNADEDANEASSINFITRSISEGTAAPGGEYFNLVSWLNLNTLFNRMVAAGRLP